MTGKDTSEDGTQPSSVVNRLTTGEDRVRMVARQLSEPRTTNWIATEAKWSNEPTKRVLERLVDDGVLHRDEEGTHTTYRPDYRQQAMREAMALHDAADSVEELTDRLSEMKSQIDDWKTEYGVSSPNELRATIADEGLTPEEGSHRRDVARSWDRLESRLELVSFAVREWDFLSLDAAFAEASY
ncbi:DUF7342 family protein [Salinigranum halophilum]|uniref:DUF7342 family protein n=1 Tax=Salinigranum halophilum TaxID=2565931 RepID=UPI0010A8ECFA|nr:hypothetical protein [Salinigranum halophilum]